VGSPSRKWQILATVAALVAAVVVCLTVPGPGERPKNVFGTPAEQSPPPGDEEDRYVEPPFEFTDGRAEFGNPEAAVRIVAFIPAGEGCGDETAVFVKALAQANEDRLHVEVVDFNNAQGAAYQQELGTTCAGLMINGKQTIETTDDNGQPKTIEFGSNLGEFYTESDLLKALDLEFEQAYEGKCKRPAPAAEEAGTEEGVDAADAPPTTEPGE
jgi:hypothetical protein